MDTAARAVSTGLLFLFVFVSGIWLSRTGRPLNVALSTVHKLISLAAGSYLLVTVYQRHQQVPLDSVEWLVIAVTGLCFLGVVASGGLLSTESSIPVFVLRVHQVMPVLILLSSTATMYLMLGS